MLILGVILIVLGLLVPIPVLFDIGVVLAIVGAILLFTSGSRGGRYYY